MTSKRLILLVLYATSPICAADIPDALVPEEVVASTPDAMTIDSWKPKTSFFNRAPRAQKSPEAVTVSTTAAAPIPEESPVTSPVPQPPVQTQPFEARKLPSMREKAPARPTGMNQMEGTLSSFDSEKPAFRLSMEGGFQPQFDYDEKTVVEEDGRLLTMRELSPGDHIIVRYMGKDLTARNIERIRTPAQ